MLIDNKNAHIKDNEEKDALSDTFQREFSSIGLWESRHLLEILTATKLEDPSYDYYKTFVCDHYDYLFNTSLPPFFKRALKMAYQSDFEFLNQFFSQKLLKGELVRFLVFGEQVSLKAINSNGVVFEHEFHIKDFIINEKEAESLTYAQDFLKRVLKKPEKNHFKKN